MSKEYDNLLAREGCPQIMRGRGTVPQKNLTTLKLVSREAGDRRKKKRLQVKSKIKQ
jgi:hypothetical protein